MVNSKKKNGALSSFTDAQKQFQLWRATKIAGETIPDRLWAIVAKLLEDHSFKRSHISKALGITTRQLRNKFPRQFKNKPADITPTLKHTDVFVEAPLQSISNHLSSATQFIIEKNNGTKLIFPSVTQEQFALLLKTFME